MFSDWLPSNLKQPSELLVPNPEPPPDPTLILPNPNPSDEDKDETMNTLVGVAMEWGTEERIFAPKLYTSQNPSTSVVPARYLHDDSDNVKKRKAHDISKSCDNLTYVEGSTDRAHWEPPFERSTHHQE